MDVYEIKLVDLPRTVIPLGFTGENEHRQIKIDCATVFEESSGAVPALSVRPPQGEDYPAVITRDNNFVLWTVKDSDVAYEGDGSFQLTFTDGTEVGKRAKGKFHVDGSIANTGDPPDPIADWLVEAGTALDEIPQDIEDAIDETMGEITATAETLTAGSSATASFDAEDKVLTIGVPVGADGQDGHSPVVTASKAGKVTTISVDGTGIATITDGTDGQDGDDGYSPTATVTKSGKVATISITDANGTTTATVSDGDSAADIIDDNAGSGDTNKVWSADKSAAADAALLSQITQKAPVIVSSASGAVATFSDAIPNEPLTECVVQINPVQASGTPSPENPLPITGWTGANVSRTGENVFDAVAWVALGVNSTKYEVGSNCTITVKENDTSGISNRLISLVPGVVYSFYKDSNFSQVRVYNSSGSSIESSGKFTVPSDGKVAIKLFANSYPTSGKFCIVLGSTQPTECKPYTGTTYPISWQTEAGTVYGGQLDVTNGVLTVDRARVDLGTLTNSDNTGWKYVTNDGDPYFVVYLTGKQKGLSGMVCDTYATNATTGTGTLLDKHIGAGMNDVRVYLKDSAYTSLSSFLTAMSGVYLVYTLATSVTYQLDPVTIKTLATAGQNSIWADTGDTFAQYKADTKAYIDGLTKPDDDMIANANIANNKYFTVNNHLYKSTQTISSGATIVPGVNCTETDIASALNALA